MEKKIVLILKMVKKKKIFLFSINKSFFAKTDLHVVELFSMLCP